MATVLSLQHLRNVKIDVQMALILVILLAYLVTSPFVQLALVLALISAYHVKMITSYLKLNA